jgi:magnesium-transporting ATPase (P-type)
VHRVRADRRIGGGGEAARDLEQGEVPLGDRENMVFMGTSVAAGTGQAVVVATAMKTELGRIAGLIEEGPEEEGTPLQKKLDSFGRILVWAALGIVALLFRAGAAARDQSPELFMTSVSLAVAAVPEGLAGRGHGCARARRAAHVPPRAGAQTAGGRNARLDHVICTDKTGTLTVGEMTVRALYVAGQSYEVTGEGYGPDGEVRFEARRPAARTRRRCSNSRPSSSAATTRISFRRKGVENRRRSHRRRLAWPPAPKPAATASVSSGVAENITRFPSTPTANGAR